MLAYLLTYLRDNALFCMSVALCAAVVLLVPQINGVMLQTVETPIIPHRQGGPLGGLLSESTIEAAGFLAYLSLLFAGSLAASRWVLPTSWFVPPGPAVPPVAPWPGKIQTGLGIVVLLLSPVLVLCHVPSWLVLPVTVILLYRLMCLIIDQMCAWFYSYASMPPFAAAWKWGIALTLIGLAGLGFTHFKGALGLPYLRGECVLPTLGGFCVLAGLWLIFPPGPNHICFGRLLGWLLISYLFGELFWIAAQWSVTAWLISFRLYSIWAILEVLVLVVLVAAFLDTLEKNTQKPCRVLGVVGFTVLFFLLRVPAPELLRDLERSPGEAVVGADEWAVHLLERIQKVPNNGPVVLVAAAGGGSRAAIFAGLVLESLAREPFGKGNKKTWGNHVVLVSGVSGGSLGTARYIQGLRSTWSETYSANARADLMNTVRAELASRMADRAKDLHDQVVKEEETLKKVGKSSDYRVPAEQTLEFCNWFRDHAHEDLSKSPPPQDVAHLAWVVQSAIMDDLCTDFMAPVLRGVLTPVYSRGEILRRFWTEKFGWDGSQDRGGYAVGCGHPSYDPDRYPLALYNTSDVRRGCRVAVGFPPLPVRFLRSAPRKTEAAPGASQDWPLRNPPEGLADLDPGCIIHLADAVGLSANFPFGFNAVKLKRRQFDDPLAPEKDSTPEQREEVIKGLADEDDLDAKLLDGGIVDNTGIDSIYLVVESVRQKALDGKQRGKADTYTRIWDELLARRVYLIEIDSGAKPEKPGFATRWFSLFFDPLAGLNNAGYTNAGRDKHRYFTDLAARFRAEVDLSDYLAQIPAETRSLSGEAKDLQQRLVTIQRQGMPRFSPLTFDANHFEETNVLTAWSLAPSDKALLLVRFLAEFQAQKPNLNWLVELAKTPLEQQRASVRMSADKLVRDLSKARASQELQKTLEALDKELAQFKQLVQQKKFSAAETKIKQLESRLLAAQKQSAAAGVQQPEVKERLAKLQKAVAEARQTLVAKKQISPDVLDTLTISREGALGSLLLKLPAQRSKLYESSRASFEQGNKTAEVQKKINKTNMDSRILFDRTMPSKKAPAQAR
jgi:hypothetical protein